MRASVTIAIPTRNRREFLAAALESALAASGANDQVIVSDNASTDTTGGYLGSIRDPRVTILRQAADLGMVGNWNACLRAAQGDRFVLLSDDDLLERGSIEALSALIADERVAVAYGRSRVIDQKGVERTLGHLAPARESLDAFLPAWFGYARTIYPCATILRTEEIRATGGYDARFGAFADVGAWLGVWRRDVSRDIAFTPATVAAYRSHEGALSTGDLKGGIGGLRALQATHREIGANAEVGFEGMAAHYVASALRRRARSSSVPVPAYLGLLVRDLPLVWENWAFDAYWRQLMILADPEGYERDKRDRAQSGGAA